MTQVLTLAEGRALLAQQKGGKKAGFVTPKPLSPPAPSKEPRAPAASGVSQENPKPESPALPQAETRLIGPYALCLADPKHYPGRYRHTVTGPATPGLTDALEAALQEFIRLTPLTEFVKP